MGDSQDNSRPPFTILTAEQLGNTLIPKLTLVADKLRDLKTRLGARPYQVSLVTLRWSGGRRNHGTCEVDSVRPILPTPLVVGLDNQNLMLQAIGLDEVGTVRVSEISPSYTEDELRGVGPQGQPLPSDREFYWEITYPRPAPAFAVKRRYQVRGTPGYDATKFRWIVTLIKATEDRDRVTGQPGGLTG